MDLAKDAVPSNLPSRPIAASMDHQLTTMMLLGHYRSKHADVIDLWDGTGLGKSSEYPRKMVYPLRISEPHRAFFRHHPHALVWHQYVAPDHMDQLS